MMPDAWPQLPYEDWTDTRETLHLWMQIVGKIRLAMSPWVNHSWHVTLYLTARGLTTGPMAKDDRIFQIDFDFVDQRLTIQTADGAIGGFDLQPRTVASFYRQLLDELGKLGLQARIHDTPNEIPAPIPFRQDELHHAYDGSYAQRFWRALLQADRVFRIFRARFAGKCSPVHFFWGAPDLAVTRFSGRPAPLHPGGIPNLPDRVTRDAYSHEVSSCGFWAGGDPIRYAAFYSYAYPEPPGFSDAAVGPTGTFYSQALREFILPYDAVRLSSSPDATLLEFLEDSYEAAARLGGWDRAALERPQEIGS
jgi:Family of unknown function (DUF5996)